MNQHRFAFAHFAHLEEVRPDPKEGLRYGGRLGGTVIALPLRGRHAPSRGTFRRRTRLARRAGRQAMVKESSRRASCRYGPGGESYASAPVRHDGLLRCGGERVKLTSAEPGSG